MTEFNFWPYATGSKKKQSFYIFGGIGLTGYNPQGVYDDQWVDLRPLGTDATNSIIKSAFLRYHHINGSHGMGLEDL